MTDEAGKAIDVSCMEFVAEEFPQERLDVGAKFCFFCCTEEVGERGVVLFLPLELSFGERKGEVFEVVEDGLFDWEGVW